MDWEDSAIFGWNKLSSSNTATPNSRAGRLPPTRPPTSAYYEVDVIVAANAAQKIAKKATSTIPIVMLLNSDDPFRSGFVDHLRAQQQHTNYSSVWQG